MIKLLGAIAIIGTAWAGSQYLTTSSGDLDEMPGPVAGTSPGTNSVALLDFAVAVLPQSQSAETDYAPVDVVAEPPVSAPVEAQAQTAMSSPEPEDAESDPDLARRLQVELRRVGCLKAGADGVWGRASQRAMQRFADRIDAALPTDRPDAVLLMLVEKYEDRACGTPCAAGQQPDARGRCQARIEVAAVESPPEQVAAIVEGDIPAIVSDDSSASVSTPVVAGLHSVQPVKAKTTIGRSNRNAPLRSVRIKNRKTIWSAPAYGLGMVQAKPVSTKKKRKRVGASAAYRRWMSRTGMSMR